MMDTQTLMDQLKQLYKTSDNNQVNRQSKREKDFLLKYSQVSQVETNLREKVDYLLTRWDKGLGRHNKNNKKNE